jgi:hypothetical protein
VWWRIPLAGLFLVLALAGFYGFMAAHEPGDEAFELPYLAFSLGAVGVAAWLVFRHKRPHDTGNSR